MNEPRFEKILEHLKNELKNLNVGRASPALIQDIVIEIASYGSASPLEQLASIQSPDPKTLLVQPWDKSILRDIEKGIRTSGRDLNPVVDGNAIRVNFPSLTEDRRRELVKVLHKKFEEARVSIRRIREDILKDWKSQKDNGTLSEDIFFRQSKDLQSSIDAINKEIESIGQNKEKEILTV